jgi:ATP-binding cassette subfamily B protein
MIADLMLAGRELAGTTDPRVARGLRLSVLEAVFAAAPFPLLYLLLLDVFQGRVDVMRTLWIAAGMAVLLVARIAASMRAMPAIFTGAYAMMGQARLRVADHLRQLPLGWFATTRSGSVSASLAADLALVEDLWAHFLGVFFGGLLMPLFLSLFLVWLDWRLGLVVLATLPCAFALFAGAQRVLVAQSRRLTAASAHGNAEVLDYVQGIAVVRSFGRGGPAFERVRSALAAIRRAALSLELWPAPLVSAFGFAVEIGFVVAVWFGVQRLAAGSLAPETLLLFAVLSLPVYRQLFEVGLSFLMLRYAQESLARIRALLAQPALPEPQQPRAPHGHDIELDAVDFRYDGQAQAALHGVSLRIAARSLTAIVGPSGSGKTTLVHLVARLWDVGAGAIRVGGVDVREIGTDNLHRHVGMVFQDVVLFSGSVLDNLRVGRPDASRDEATAAARLAEAHAFIERLPQGYDTPLGENGARLSGGERQRLSIARALLKDAPILLLDEATASVDPSAEAAIQRALSTLVRDRTVVVIAHRLRSVRHADLIVVLDAGRVVEQGRHDDLVAAGGVYARLWQCQQASHEWRIAQ